jgi:TonB family protein
MSDEPASRRQAAPQVNVRARHSSGIGKWAAGAAVAALLLGGGYYAWSQYGKNPSAAEVADNSGVFSAPAYDEAVGKAAPIEEATGNAARAQPAAVGGVTADRTYAAKEKTAAAPKRTTKTEIAAAEIPAETIGVSNTAVTSQSDELVVNAPHRPVWRSTPSAERLSSYYPTFALDRGREGEASLTCTVGQKGILACERVSESPTRAGFGAAALRVAHAFRHAERRVDGSSAVGTQVNLRVLFRMAEDERRG